MDDLHLNNTQNIVFLKKDKNFAPKKPKKPVFKSSVLTSEWCGAKSTTKNEYVTCHSSKQRIGEDEEIYTRKSPRARARE
jgi:hypothetical protein